MSSYLLRRIDCQAIARRIGAGKQILLADLRQENANAAASAHDAGFEVSTAIVDVSRASRFTHLSKQRLRSVA